MHIFFVCCASIIKHYFDKMFVYGVHTVPICGTLFEWYMEVCASYSQNRKWSRILTENATGDGFPLSDETQRQLMEQNGNGFVGWCLYHVSAIGTRCRRQMFYHTFVATYFGLSREGVDMLSRYGFAQALRTFDDTRNDIRLSNEEKTRYENGVCLCDI